MTTEQQVLELIATDRLDMPVSSLSSKLKKMKPKLAKGIVLDGDSFEGERVYARVESEDTMKARGMREGVDTFKERYPQYGKILEGLIAEKREEHETHLYFGMQPGSRLTSDDYMNVMRDLGFTDIRAKALYSSLLEVTYNLAKKRQEERSVLIG